MSNAIALSVILLSLNGLHTQGHSWVACTDYRGDVNRFEQDKCYGWPRNYRPVARSDGYQIATPDSRAYSNGGCDVAMAAGNWIDQYSEAFPYATYEPGEVYCVAWPMKNHGWLPASCDNQQSKSDAGIDDTLHLYVSAVNPLSDPTQESFNMRNINELSGFARNCNPSSPNSNSRKDECQLGLEKHQDYKPDCKGFLRAPKFCENSGMAMGTGCFKIPENMPSGHFVAQWWWQTSFRRGASLQKQAYMSCFDFQVAAAGSMGARTDAPGTKGTPHSDLPCQNNMLKFRNATSGVTSSGTPVPPDATNSSPHEPQRVCAQPHAVCDQPDLGPRCCTSGHKCAYYQDSGYARCLPVGAFPVPAVEPEGEPEPESESVGEIEGFPTPAFESEPDKSGAGTCKGYYETCAEPGWSESCCDSGHTCSYYKDSGYARCLPSTSAEPEAEPEPESKSVAVEVDHTEFTGQTCKRSYETCAEPGWGPACCVSGHTCSYHDDSGYARCLPGTSAGQQRKLCKMPGETCAEPAMQPVCCSDGYECVYWKDSGFARCTATELLQGVSEYQQESPRILKRVTSHKFLSRGQSMVQIRTVVNETSRLSLDSRFEL